MQPRPRNNQFKNIVESGEQQGQHIYHSDQSSEHMNNLFNQGEDIAHDLQCKLEGYDAVESMSLGSMNYIKEPIKRFKKPSGEAESESLPAKIRRKQDNEGGRVVKKQQIQTIFRHICSPDRLITIESLGHSLQKYKIEFQTKDLVNMIQLYHDQLGEKQEDEEEAQKATRQKECLTYNQFVDLYFAVRTRKRN